eukprot:GFYU01040957.1.p1 GENE.GFYU01040957.1~~GFYU01040957.1.p1  ORF type:complete len:208 (-),score=35.83 GFYU01040957.1:6-629(-)
MIKHFTEKALQECDRRYRTNLVNALSGVKGANVVASKSSAGKPNAALFTSVIHMGADPPLMGMLVRPNTVPRHTLENIKDTRCFTINHVTESFFQQAHLTSARTDQSEFELANLSEEYIPGFLAPFVKESPIKIGLEYVRTIDIEENGTHFVIGKVVHVLVPETCVEESGDIDIVQAGTIGVSGLYSYHRLEKIASLPHAKEPAAQE